MIRFVLILAFCFLLNNTIRAQITADFPDSNYYYNEYRYERGSDMTDYNSIYYSVYYKKDTVLNNIRYHVLNIKFSIDYFSPSNIDTHGDFTFALLRNDVVNKKVYIKGLNRNLNFNLQLDTNERLLFDFDLKVGDLYKGNAHLYYGHDSLRVVQIDTIIGADSIKRAVFTIEPLGNNPFMDYGYLIQGIGGKNGLLGFLADAMNNVYQEDFSCYNFNGIGYTANFNGAFSNVHNAGASCKLHVFSSINDDKNRSIQFYPNPTEDFAYFNLDEKNITVQLFDSNGKLIIENSGWSNFVDLRNFECCFYLIRIITYNTVYTGKVIKSK